MKETRLDEGRRILPLDEMDDYEVAEGDPDVRGWDVVASDGQKIGEVERLLVDTVASKVRYLDVELEGDLRGESDADDEARLLIPIGCARLDEENDRVMVENVAASQVAGFPTYGGGEVTREYEVMVLQGFDPEYRASADRDPYEHEHFDEGRFFDRS